MMDITSIEQLLPLIAQKPEFVVLKKDGYQVIDYVYQDKSEGIVIGSGQHGIAYLSDEASDYLKRNNCHVILRPTPEAMQEWNKAEGKWIGLFHITC